MSRLLHLAARQPSRSGLTPQSIPFRWLRIYDDSAGKPATPTSAPTGNLLLEIDLTGSAWIGTASFAQLSSTITGTVQNNGIPLYMRVASNDGLTAIDVDYKTPLNCTSPTTQLQLSCPPDDTAGADLGQWIVGTPVDFAAGDLVYTP